MLTWSSDDGIVVVEVEKGTQMGTGRVPPALYGRLGDSASAALEEMFDDAGEAWRSDMLAMAQERFDRRLAEELALFRQDMVQSMSDLRIDLHREIQTTRVDLMKWSFLFWIGQLAAVGGLVFALNR